MPAFSMYEVSDSRSKLPTYYLPELLLGTYLQGRVPVLERLATGSGLLS